jgi:hypothetical protein
VYAIMAQFKNVRKILHVVLGAGKKNLKMTFDGNDL